MLVVCILGVLLATSLPRFAGTHRNLHLGELAKTLCAQLRFCQEYALANGVEVQMSYVPQTRAFVVLAATDAATDQLQHVPMPWDSVLDLPLAVEMTQFAATYADGRSEMDRVVFRPYGSAPAVELVLQSGTRRIGARYAGSTRLVEIGE